MTEIDKQVDPELWPLVEAFPPIDISAETLDGFRTAMVDLSIMPEPSTHTDIHIEEINQTNIRGLLFRPLQQTSSAGALLHIHGGGFVMGMPEMDAARNIELARATGCTIFSVKYRLAPENPHPAGLHDCHDALVWLAEQSDALGFAPERIGVIGESAGGGLAAALALFARDKNSVALNCQVLIYPMLIPPTQSLDDNSSDAPTGRYIWTRASNNFAWSANLSGGAADHTTIAGLAPDVSGLPPTFLAVGALDLFVHDNLAYVSKLLAKGCVVESHVYPGAIHGFDRMVDALVSQRYTKELTDFICKHLG